MLQQTQVERVIPKYIAFLRRFPDAKTLARASLPAVFRVWQGLGYNRRAKLLRDAAHEIQKQFGGKFPRTAAELECLPGVGHYTARAVAAFAFNRPEIFIETNIRTVFLHHCFPRRTNVSDTDILPLIRESLIRANTPPRDFYAALMDYGSHLKKSGVRLNAKSKHYTKQSKFEGSRRQLRGNILKLLLQKPHTPSALARECGRPLAEVHRELARLESEKMIRRRAARIFLAD